MRFKLFLKNFKEFLNDFFKKLAEKSFLTSLFIIFLAFLIQMKLFSSYRQEIEKVKVLESVKIQLDRKEMEKILKVLNERKANFEKKIEINWDPFSP